MRIVMANRVQQIPPYLFAAARRRVAEARTKGAPVIDLGVGDPDIPTPEVVVSALKHASTDPENHRYPRGESSGHPVFRTAVSRWMRRRFGVDVDPATEVVALIGSKEGSHHLALGLLNPGDLALVPSPGYTPYKTSSLFAGAEVYEVPLLARNGFLPDLSQIPSDVARRAKIFFINYPSNPTTAVAPTSFYQELVAFAREHRILLCNDNAYCDIAFGETLPGSLLQVPDARDMAVELFSCSKSFNMTGWRIGMAVGNRDLIAAITKIKDNTDSGPFAAVQLAAAAALDNAETITANMRQIYLARREKMVTALQAAGLEVEPPAGTCFLWAPVPATYSSDQFAALLLERTAIAVMPGSGYGQHGEGYFRISLTVPDELIEEAAKRVRNLSL